MDEVLTNLWLTNVTKLWHGIMGMHVMFCLCDFGFLCY